MTRPSQFSVPDDLYPDVLERRSQYIRGPYLHTWAVYGCIAFSVVQVCGHGPKSSA
jgi:hypothetical protein